MSQFEIFAHLQGQPKIQLFKLQKDGIVRDLIEATSQYLENMGTGSGEVFVMQEGSEEVIPAEVTFDAAGMHNRSRVYVGRTRLVQVTVNYRTRQEHRSFSPAVTVGVVKKWADREFGLSGPDSTEYMLQVCDTNIRPTEDTHLGALLSNDSKSLCLDLVFKERVEG